MGWFSDFVSNAQSGFGGGGGETGASIKKRLKLNIRNDVANSQIDDLSKQTLLGQIDTIPEVDTQEWDDRINGVLETLKAKKALASDVAARYADAVANAKKTQSTILTKGLPAAQVPTGTGTSLITSGKVK